MFEQTEQKNSLTRYKQLYCNNLQTKYRFLKQTEPVISCYVTKPRDVIRPISFEAC